MQDPRDRQTPQLKPVVQQPTAGRAPSLERIGAPATNTAARKLSSRPIRRVIFGALGAAALLAAVGFGLNSLSGPRTDELTARQIADMNASWAAASARGIDAKTVAPTDIHQAIETMNLAPDQAEALEHDASAGRISLVWVTVWDDMAEDGDIVALSSEGVRTVVTLKNAQATIALPRPTGGVINMEGVTDGGGGGITVGILSGGTQVQVAPMKPGELLGIPLR
jgi:hypothetical protein